MTGVEIAAPGAAALAADLQHAAAQVGDLDGPLADAATDVIGHVRAPVRTGALARSVQAVPDALGFTLTAGGPSAPYGPIVHAYNPFLSRALEQRQAAIVDDIADHITTALGQINGD